MCPTGSTVKIDLSSATATPLCLQMVPMKHIQSQHVLPLGAHCIPNTAGTTLPGVILSFPRFDVEGSGSEGIPAKTT